MGLDRLSFVFARLVFICPWLRDWEFAIAR